ncbi:hypothetical protein GCM10009780_04150 [Actinomadura alba]
MISVHDAGVAGALGELSWFRREFYQCLTARADALFELTNAVLCADGPVHSLADTSWREKSPPRPASATKSPRKDPPPR